MNTSHESDDHAQRLHAFLEENDARAALRASSLADCEDCQVQLEELLSLRGSLDFLGDEERVDLAAAQTTPSPLPAGHVQDALRDAQPSVAPNRRRLHPAWILVAAAAAILLIVQPFGSKDSGTQDLGPTLGEQTSEHLITPLANGDSLSEFKWSPHPAPGVTYQVFVYADADNEHEIARSATIGAQCVWHPKPNAIPAEGLEVYYWTVEVSPDMAGSPTDFWSRGPLKP